jgi:hypothetical protein
MPHLCPPVFVPGNRPDKPNASSRCASIRLRHHDNLCKLAGGVRSAALDGVDLVVHCGDITTLANSTTSNAAGPRRTDDRADPRRLDDGPMMSCGARSVTLPDPRAGTDWAEMFDVPSTSSRSGAVSR